jgi:hypothetical protein
MGVWGSRASILEVEKVVIDGEGPGGGRREEMFVGR